MSRADGARDRLALNIKAPTRSTVSTPRPAPPFLLDNFLQIGVNDLRRNVFLLDYRDVTLSSPSFGSTAMTPAPVPAAPPPLAAGLGWLGAAARRRG